VSTIDQPLVHGDVAPDFDLPDATGRKVGLRDFAGRRVIVYFYPAAMTPGCTTEACGFRDGRAHLDAADVAVVGISRDDVAALAEFTRQEGLAFPLLSDEDRDVHRRYGVLGTKIVDGAEVERVRRSTFVIGVNGRVERAMYDVVVANHVAELLADL
jgi:thioredoxin-dependent peroxiredoxin